MLYDEAETGCRIQSATQDAKNGLRKSLQMAKRVCSKEVLESMRKAGWSDETISLYEKRSSWRLPLGAIPEPQSPIEEEAKPGTSKPRNLREYMRQKGWGK